MDLQTGHYHRFREKAMYRYNQGKRYGNTTKDKVYTILFLVLGSLVCAGVCYGCLVGTEATIVNVGRQISR